SWLAPKYWSGVTILSGFARLKPQVTLEQARAEMEVLNRRYIEEHSTFPFEKDAVPHVELLKDRLVANVRPILRILLGAVGCVLLIACANVAGLLLARSAARSRELAVRAALGAGRGRLIRQLLAESLLLSASGGAAGILLAAWGLRMIAATNALSPPSQVSPLSIPGAGDLRLDGIVLGFTALLSTITGVLFGLFPSLRASRPDVAHMMRARGEDAGRLSVRTGTGARSLLTVGQIALSIVLLIGAALLMKSFVLLHNVNPGFEPANLLTMKIALPPARYDTSAKRAAFFGDLTRRVAAIPGVRSATVAMSLPTTSWLGTNVRMRGQTQEESQPQTSQLQSVTPGYFRTLGVPLRRGREFVPQD
ncbi:MAG: FtsX-like permease family protein, partial [Bryobacteraceae bacterium]